MRCSHCNSYTEVHSEKTEIKEGTKYYSLLLYLQRLFEEIVVLFVTFGC